MKKIRKDSEYKKYTDIIDFERGRILGLAELLREGIEENKMTAFLIKKLEDINSNLYSLGNMITRNNED